MCWAGNRRITHYAEDPRFYRGMNASSATGCRISILRLFEPKEDFGAADSCRRGSTIMGVSRTNWKLNATYQ